MNAKLSQVVIPRDAGDRGQAIVAVDLGNSAAKWAIDDQPEQRVSLRMPRWSEELIEQVEQAVGSRRASWRIASVNRPITKLLVGRLHELFPDGNVLTVSFADIPMVVKVANPDRVGIDRLLAAWMCSQMFPGDSAIIVDAGSAITVDVVSAQAEFLGGAILPGIALQFDSLARGTDALPAIDLLSEEGGVLTRESLAMPATDTISAIRSGILLGTAAAIDGLIDLHFGRSHRDGNTLESAEPSSFVPDPTAATSIREVSSAKPCVVFTGGDASILSRLTTHPHVLAPRLVLDAIQLIGDPAVGKSASS